VDALCLAEDLREYFAVGLTREPHDESAAFNKRGEQRIGGAISLGLPTYQVRGPRMCPQLPTHYFIARIALCCPQFDGSFRPVRHAGPLPPARFDCPVPA
jgi:hypothetical protein